MCRFVQDHPAQLLMPFLECTSCIRWHFLVWPLCPLLHRPAQNRRCKWCLWEPTFPTWGVNDSISIRLETTDWWWVLYMIYEYTHAWWLSEIISIGMRSKPLWFDRCWEANGLSTVCREEGSITFHTWIFHDFGLRLPVAIGSDPLASHFCPTGCGIFQSKVLLHFRQFQLQILQESEHLKGLLTQAPIHQFADVWTSCSRSFVAHGPLASNVNWKNDW